MMCQSSGPGLSICFQFRSSSIFWTTTWVRLLNGVFRGGGFLGAADGFSLTAKVQMLDDLDQKIRTSGSSFRKKRLPFISGVWQHK